MDLKNLYYKLPTTGNSFQIIYDAYRILSNYIGLYVSFFLCVLGALCGFLFFWFRPKARLCRSFGSAQDGVCEICGSISFLAPADDWTVLQAANI